MAILNFPKFGIGGAFRLVNRTLLSLGVLGCAGPIFAQVITEFGGSAPLKTPAEIVSGPDGNLWFTESGADCIVRITPAGAMTRFCTGISPGAAPRGIALGSDGNLWFTEPGVHRIGRITSTGTVTEFSTGISPGASPYGITSGPGGLWFTEIAGNRIGQITTAGVVTEFSAGINAVACGSPR